MKLAQVTGGFTTRAPVADARVGSKAARQVSSTINPRTSDSIRRIREFPGEDAPGTGHRHFPRVTEGDVRVAHQKHEMKTTAECYKEFAGLSRASCPIEIKDHSPSGADVKKSPDAGPATGHRRRPMPFENPLVHPVDPIRKQSREARLKELEIRRGC
ncbi:hypothetical protein BSKO_05017 [Bryopsis sp. KO-2023]|nr:hypothetical protein BSKO_05017 [Bryopsis sp. KO-2023]